MSLVDELDKEFKRINRRTTELAAAIDFWS